MKFKYHRWFQALVVPLVALAFHIFFGYRVIGRENIPEGGTRFTVKLPRGAEEEEAEA